METQQQRGKKVQKRSEQNDETDRLSNLPDPIIAHILSSMDTEDAVRTCVLSKKWRRHWTYIHSLSFNNTRSKVSSFKKFYFQVLKHRKPFNLSKMRFKCHGISCSALVEELSEYANRHRVEELEICLRIFRSSLLKCTSPKTFNLSYCEFKKELPIFNFAPNLKTLKLSKIRVSYKSQSYDLFNTCLNLEDLSLSFCHVSCNIFKIAAPRLVNLTVGYLTFPHINVKTNLLMISTPTLKFAEFKGSPLKLSMDEFMMLEKVNIHLCSWRFEEGYVSGMNSMVKSLCHAKSISASWEYREGKIVMYPDKKAMLRDRHLIRRLQKKPVHQEASI